MLIDMHTHTFPDKIAASVIDKLAHAAHMKAYTDGSASSLKDSMKKAQARLSIVLPVATKAEQVDKINSELIKRCKDPSYKQLTKEFFFEGNEPLLYSFASMHPDSLEWERQLEDIAEVGIKGIKLHPHYQRVNFDDERYIRILRKCADLNLIVLTHAGHDIGLPEGSFVTPKLEAIAFEKAARPDLKLVLAHMGGWNDWENVLKYLKGFPVYYDTAFVQGEIEALEGEEDQLIKDFKHLLDRESFLHMVREIGSEKIMFGSDSPWSDQLESKLFIENCGLNKEEQAQILYKNALDLLCD